MVLTMKKGKGDSNPITAIPKSEEEGQEADA